MTTILPYLLTITAFLIAITFHEFSHAFTAYLLGDDTAKKMGRLTLNPISHIDPIGFLLLLLVGFGWAKPVIFNPKNFEKPRLYSVLVGLAGPFSNFLLALISLYLIHYMNIKDVNSLMFNFLKTSVWINVMLGVFNILPVPPLDGGHLIGAFIPDSWKVTYFRLQPILLIALVILLSIPAISQIFLNSIKATIAFLSLLVI